MRAVLLACALLASTGARSAQAPPWNGESYGLFRGQHESGRILFRVPSGPCQRAAERLAGALEAEGVFAVSRDEEDRGAMRVLVGAPEDPELEALARACGVEPVAGGFRVFERDYLAPGDAAVAVFEDPLRAGRPLCLVLGNDRELVAHYLDGIPRLSRPHLWVHADGELALECTLGPGGRPRAHEVRDYQAQRADYFDTGPSIELEHFVVRARNPPDAERWNQYRTALTLARERVLDWLDAEEAPRVEVLLYEHLEDFERCLGTSALYVANRLRPRVHVLLAPGMPHDAGAAMARVLARAVAGEPVEAWLEDGIAVAAADSWWGRPLARWVRHLAVGQLMPAAEELGPAAAWRQQSEHVLLPARAFLFQRSVQVLGEEPGKVRALWKGAGLGDPRVSARYERALARFEAESKERESTPRARGRAEREGGRAAPGGRGAQGERNEAAPRAEGPQAGDEPADDGRFQRGLALVAGETSSYSSRSVDEALAAAQELGGGPNAVSLTVFGSGEDPLPAACSLAPRAVHGSASDLALASASAAARRREMSVLLALEVLSGPSGAWADNISWTGVDDTREFFLRYRRVALHYALLAELLEVQAYCFGANLREATRTDPKGPVRDPKLFEQRRRGWGELIGLLRRVFDGKLTHTFRFPGEGSESDFLEQLDCVGVSLYARVALPGRVPSDEELRRNLRFELQQAIDLAVRWNKPLVLVQLGFPARSESWSTPTVPRGSIDPEAQQRFHEAVADVLSGRLENAATLSGFYLWNWPLDPPRPGAPEGGFGLRGQPAESALRRLFER